MRQSNRQSMTAERGRKYKVGPMAIISLIINVIFVQILFVSYYFKSPPPPAVPMEDQLPPKKRWRKDYSAPKKGLLGKLLTVVQETPRPTMPRLPTPAPVAPEPTAAPVKHLAPQYLPKFLLSLRNKEAAEGGGAVKPMHNNLHEKVSRRLLTPSYDVQAIEDMKKRLEKLFPNENSYVPCLEGQCDTSLDRIWAYNPWTRPLYLCGQKIMPQSAMEIVKRCHEGARVFSQEPTLRNIEIDEPIDVLFMRKTKGLAPPTTYECPVPCRQFGEPASIATMYIDGEDWMFYFTMESSSNYPEYQVKSESWKNNVFYATTSFKSEIPLPYFSYAEYDIQTPQIDYDSVIKGATFIASNCDTLNRRDDVVKDLMKIIRVDSFGSCLHNKDRPVDDKHDMQKDYMFHLAFENTNEEDYVTEKMWGTLRSGTLPVYMGAPNIKEHVPENSTISWHDFPSTQALGEYLQKVAADKHLYDSYHAWRSQPLQKHFHAKYDITRTHSTCRACKWAYAKQRGLGWNHDTQDFRQLHRSRRLCLDSEKFIVEPFVETVMTNHNKDARHEKPDGKPHCHVANIPRVEKVGKWERTVWYHDGVTDIVLEGSSNDIYRIATGMKGRATKLRDNVYQLQDEVSRITFAVDKTVLVSHLTTPEGVVDFRLSHQSQEPKRIRIISDDVDTFHKGASEAVNFYSDMMVSEFQHPLQFFKELPKKKNKGLFG